MTQKQIMSGDSRKKKLTFLTKLTAVALIGFAVAIWIQALSGDPAYTKFPPGPIIFVAIAAVIVLGARWWWTPILGALVSLMTTTGLFLRLSAEILRLSHPASIGRFAIGIFIGTLLHATTLFVADIASVAATIQNYRRLEHSKNSGVKALCQILGVVFVLMGLMMVFRGGSVNQYHNLLHLVWGASALYFGFIGSTLAAKNFCIGSGAFYFVLGVLGMLFGNSLANEAWHVGPMLLHTGDHIFHMVLGSAILATGLLTGRQWLHHASPV